MIYKPGVLVLCVRHFPRNLQNFPKKETKFKKEEVHYIYGLIEQPKDFPNFYSFSFDSIASKLKDALFALNLVPKNIMNLSMAIFV